MKKKSKGLSALLILLCLTTVIFGSALTVNAAGYRLPAWMIESYNDWLIRRDPQEFAAAGFIGTQAYNVTVPR